MANEIGTKIRKLREEKGISQEYVATFLGLSQSNYGRLEKDDSRITIPKLYQIASALEVQVANLLGETSSQIINQNNNESANAYNVDTLISDKEHIQSLKEEISFLRKIICEEKK